MLIQNTRQRGKRQGGKSEYKAQRHIGNEAQRNTC